MPISGQGAEPYTPVPLHEQMIKKPDVSFHLNLHQLLDLHTVNRVQYK
jgi:hypothetical protein